MMSRRHQVMTTCDNVGRCAARSAWGATCLLLAGASLGAEELRTIDRIDDVSKWSLNADGGERIEFRADPTDCHSGPASMRVTFRGDRWGNLRCPTTIPPNATAVVLWARVHKASLRSSMYVWLFEPDGDGHLAAVTLRGGGPGRWPGGWQRIRVPLGRFRYDPRGDRKRNLLSIDRMLLGFNYAPMELCVDDVAWELRAGVGVVPSPRSTSFDVEPGKLGRVGVLDQPGLGVAHAHHTASRLTDVLRSAGFGVTTMLAGDLADKARLSRSNLDLLVLAQGAAFPADAKANLQRFLKAGGSMLTANGYAFDTPTVHAEGRWRPVGTVETAAEIQAGGAVASRINTRFGRPGDTMGFEKTQIGMFDPSYPFEQVVRAEIAGRRIDGSLTGWVACITDPTGSPVYGKANLRFIPQGATFDRLGRSRGPLGGVAHHFAGPYAGSSWAFFGVEDRDLFAEGGLPDAYVVALARRLVDQVYLHGLTTDLACYRDGETVTIIVDVANRGRNAAAGGLRISVEDHVVHDAQVQMDLHRGQSRRITATWKPDRFDRDFYRVRATLTLPHHTDEIENGFCAWRDEVVRAGPKISLRDNAFRIDDRPAFLTGTNQTGRMWLAAYENPLVWRDDFAGMRDHGMVLWRILHFSAVMHRNDPMALAGSIPEKILRETDAIVQLAQKYGVVVFLTMHDWMPVELTDAQLAAQAKWNAFWAGRYKDVPGIIYDVQNEPSMHVGDAPHVVAEWKQMLTERYGGIEAAAKRWGIAAADASALKPQAAGKMWRDLKAVDVERFRVDLLNRWVKGNVEPIHQADPDALVTVGYLQRLRPADKALGARHVDFSNMHSYLPLRAFPADFKIMDRRAAGKTMTLGEFGQREAHDARTHGETGDRPVESIQRYMVYNHYAMGLGGSFTASWCWRDMPDCVFPWGMTRPDHLPKPVLRAYRNFTLMSRFIRPTYRAPSVWLILPDAHRLGALWGRIDAAIGRTIDTLLGLRVAFGVLRECDVVAGVLDDAMNVRAGSDAKKRALVWPIPYCPDDATFEAIRKNVEAGASLYLSGDVSFDELRRPTKASRLAALGLKLDAHRPPFARGDSKQTTGRTQRTRVEQGRVFFVPDPIELTDANRLRDELTAFLDHAEAVRIPIQPEHPDLHAFITHAADGLTTYSAVNHGEPRTVTLAVGREPTTIELGAPGYGLAAFDRIGALTMVQTQGAVRRGSTSLVDAEADVIVIALDGRDVAESSRLLLLPSFAGRVAISTRRTWSDPIMTTGEVVNGRFKVLAQRRIDAQAKRFTLPVDPDEALSMIVMTERDQAEAAARQIAETLTLHRP